MTEIKRPRMYGDNWPKIRTVEEFYEEIMNKGKESEGTRLAKEVFEKNKKMLAKTYRERVLPKKSNTSSTPESCAEDMRVMAEFEQYRRAVNAESED